MNIQNATALDPGGGLLYRIQAQPAVDYRTPLGERNALFLVFLVNI